MTATVKAAANGNGRGRQADAPQASGDGARPAAPARSAPAAGRAAERPRRDERQAVASAQATPARLTSARTAHAHTAPAPNPAPAPDTRLAGIDALAFAVDGASEHALREGLAGCRDAQVWPGNLHAAAAALDQGGYPAGLVVVDVDEIPYPAGAIYELAAVCEVGTVVIALGSTDTARFSREVLLAGVSDYLVKPVSAAEVRAAAARAVGAAANDAPQGRLVGFAGPGGSGTTTLAAATALLAAERGHYVSVLDLNRTFSAFSFLLDVEPASGLVDLLSTVARASLNPDMVDRMRATRSDRIAVYGYPWSAVPPPLAPVWAVCELLVELQRRSHLVIVDGMDDPNIRQAVLALVDARIIVAEPTVTGAAAAARMTTRLRPLLGEGWPFVLVQNHTRAFGDVAAGAQRLRRAGVAGAPGVVVPFAPTLPSLTDRGWSQGRLPAALRKPLDLLVDRILTPEAFEPAGAGEAFEETGIGREAGTAGARAPAGLRGALARIRRPGAAKAPVAAPAAPAASNAPDRSGSLRAALARVRRPRTAKAPAATPVASAASNAPDGSGSLRAALARTGRPRAAKKAPAASAAAAAPARSDSLRAALRRLRPARGRRLQPA